MKCFFYAFRGIWETIKNERNMRIHLCFAFYVVLAGLVTRISQLEWIAVLLCVGIVTALECVNTAMESLCDTVCPKRLEGIRIAKDAAAGGVLCAAIASAVVGCVVFINVGKLRLAYEFLVEQPLLSGIILLSLLPAMMFIRGIKGVAK